MTNGHTQKDGQGDWYYQDHGRLMKQCGLNPVKVYINRRQGTLQQYFET